MRCTSDNPSSWCLDSTLVVHCRPAGREREREREREGERERGRERERERERERRIKRVINDTLCDSKAKLRLPGYIVYTKVVYVVIRAPSEYHLFVLRYIASHYG